MARPVNSTYIIAEAGVNHNGSAELAIRLIDAAADAGADAVKFQTFKAERLASQRAAKAEYQKRSTEAAESQLEMLRRLELSDDVFRDLAARAKNRGMEFLSTPFDLESLRMLVGLGVRQMKLGSGDVTNAPLLRAVGRTGLRVILSTGMSTLADVEGSLGVLASAYLEHRGDPSHSPFEALTRPEGQALLEENVTLLHCTTEYPAPVEQVNLRAMDTLRQAFGVSVGYSDHTEGIAIPIAAVALGATVIEKHFTLDRSMEGPDHRASIEPSELGEMVRGIRAVELALGRSIKRPGPAEIANRSIARRSVVAAVRIARGQTIALDMLDTKRPGTGVSPMLIDELVGRPATRDYEPDDPIER